MRVSMANQEKSNLAGRVETWSRYLGLVSGLVSVLTSLTGNPLIAYISLGILGLIVAEYLVRVIFQKSPVGKAVHVLLPDSVAQRGDLVYRFPVAERRRAILWLAGLSVLFLGGGGFNLWQALKPPVNPAREGQTLILIVQFQTNVSADLESDYAQQIYGDLDKAFQDPDIRIEKIDGMTVKDPEEAWKLGQKTRAALVIWGLFDRQFVYPQYEVLGGEQVHHLKLGETPLQTDNKHLDFTVSTEIPQGMLYLTEFTIGQVYYLAHDFKNALQSFNSAFDTLEESGVLDLKASETLDWGEEYVYFYRASTLSNSGQLAPAILDYQLAIKKDPNFAEAHNNLGVGFSALADPERAIEQFSLAIQADKLAVAYYNRGSIYYHRKDFKQAIQDYSMASDIEPRTPLFHQALADAYSGICEFEEARDELTDAIDLLQDDPQGMSRALTNRGVTYTRLRENKKALQDYEHALDLDSDNASTYYNMAVMKAVMGDEESAVQMLLTAFQIDGGLKDKAACDSDFDSIRKNPQLQAVLPSPENCESPACP
jgi:tetratricopeptide (TPR) repeat protein